MSGISVILPTKDRLDFLKQTLKNILSQTVKPDEIIVVDDGSSDGTLEYLNTAQIPGVITLRNPGKGPGAARNAGFAISKGNYIQFFDSDDLMTKNKLEVQLQLIKSTGTGMVYCPHVKAQQDIEGRWQKCSPLLYFKPLPDSLRYDQWLLRGACMITQACLFTRETIEKAGGWRTDLMPHDDLEFLFRIGKVVPYPVHTSDAAVIYRQHGAQITDNLVSMKNKSLDQVKAWKLIEGEMKSGKYTWYDLQVIENNIYHSSKYAGVAESNLKKEITEYWFMLRKKIERKISGSDFFLYHKVNHSQQKFNDYLDLLP